MVSNACKKSARKKLFNINRTSKKKHRKTFNLWKDKIQETRAYATIKYLKEYFPSKSSCHFVNPLKSSISKIGKAILDNINNIFQSKTLVNQQKDIWSVLQWFANIKNNKSSFSLFLIFKPLTLPSFRICLKVWSSFHNIQLISLITIYFNESRRKIILLNKSIPLVIREGHADFAISHHNQK